MGMGRGKQIKQNPPNQFFHIFCPRAGNLDWRRGWGGGNILKRKNTLKNNICLNLFFTMLFILNICIFRNFCIFCILCRFGFDPVIVMIVFLTRAYMQTVPAPSPLTPWWIEVCGFVTPPTPPLSIHLPRSALHRHTPRAPYFYCLSYIYSIDSAIAWPKPKHTGTRKPDSHRSLLDQ